MNINYYDLHNSNIPKEFKNQNNEICIKNVYDYNFNNADEHQKNQNKLDTNENNDNKDNFVSVFDEIFNPTKYFSPINVEEELGEDEEKKKTHSESIDEGLYHNDYISKNINTKIINTNVSYSNNLNNLNNFSDNNSIENQLKETIFSLSDEKIVLILKELYIISDNGSVYNKNSRCEALFLIKKLIQELKNRINFKLNKFDKK